MSGRARLATPSRPKDMPAALPTSRPSSRPGQQLLPSARGAFPRSESTLQHEPAEPTPCTTPSRHCWRQPRQPVFGVPCSGGKSSAIAPEVQAGYHILAGYQVGAVGAAGRSHGPDQGPRSAACSLGAIVCHQQPGRRAERQPGLGARAHCASWRHFELGYILRLSLHSKSTIWKGT